MQPHRAPAPSQVYSLVVLALLGLVAWSPLAQAKGITGIIGFAHFDYRDPPPVIERVCKYTAKYSCSCRVGTNVSFNMISGCSNVSAADALDRARIACTQLCMNAERDGGGFGGGGNVLSPVRTPGTGVSLEGSGTVLPQGRDGYVGFVPRTGEVVGPLTEKEKLGEWLVEQTQAPWLWFEPGNEATPWEDPKGSAAFVQAFWSQGGAPRPLGPCGHSVQQACPLQDVKLGDSVQACAKDEDDARLIADSACAPLRYNALRQKHRTLGIAGDSESTQAPSATIVAVAPMQFIGLLPSSVEPIGPTEDWGKLVDELLERTQGTTVWLSGPPAYYSPRE
ncbi:hypothetical protein MYSTI_07897 [Myxococcus stipitatus DSM 14675]|uniref:Uncharacterized protein n=1 Tax=Myxococcus stipitatus (strain DSM 14675 / JCM 12634 / Mx s8) TaxID=1278073 RepID=L7URD5_MYXSD|nr:hypothetical protein [Myxococcus stipitatus]AGC49169.1 hypothetical protein MYSTI_07897 [Myxococcus stipitatus DSM 14675]